MMILTPLLWCQGQEGPTLGIMGLFFQLTGSIVFLIRVVVTTTATFLSTYLPTYLKRKKLWNFDRILDLPYHQIYQWLPNEPSLWLIINKEQQEDGKIDRGAMITYVKDCRNTYLMYTNCNLYFILPRQSYPFFTLVL